MDFGTAKTNAAQGLVSRRQKPLVGEVFVPADQYSIRLHSGLGNDRVLGVGGHNVANPDNIMATRNKVVAERVGTVVIHEEGNLRPSGH
ncbi:hypothetical protein BH11PSE2_BH11PSE2_19690 [soil metagenome]